MAEIPPGSLWANGLKLEEQKVEEKSRLGPEKVARFTYFINFWVNIILKSVKVYLFRCFDWIFKKPGNMSIIWETRRSGYFRKIIYTGYFFDTTKTFK